MSSLCEILVSITGSSDDLPDFFQIIEVGKAQSRKALINVDFLKVEGSLFFLASVTVGFLKPTLARYRLHK